MHLHTYQRVRRVRPTGRQILWILGIAVALVVLIRIGYALPGTGFGQSKVAQDVNPAKTLWDWLDLLIVPAVLAIGGYLFTRSENRATHAAAERRAQDEALQAYLDQMSAMLIPNENQPSLYKAHQGDSLSSVARARTLTVLPRLDDDRKGRVVQFLYESGLIAKANTILDLSGADLIGANLIDANLSGASLSETNLNGAALMGVNLNDAALMGADLMGANLTHATLRGADLSGRTNLNHALLWEVSLVGANLNDAVLWDANLSEASLDEANLSGAHLSRASLRGVSLRYADLSGATGCTEDQLAVTAKTLKGAIMPNGQPYELRSTRLPRST